MSEETITADVPTADTAAKTTRAAAKTGKKKAAGKTAKQEAAASDGGFCVYLGPSIMGVIQRGTIYRGTKAEVLASLSAAVEQYPLIAALVVTGEALPEARIKVKKPGNLLYVNYHKLAQGKK